MIVKNNWSASGFGKKISPDIITDEFLEVDVVLLLQGNNLFGDLVYTYIQILGRNLKEMFKKMQLGENFKPSDFGTVLAAGRGEPSKEVRDEMKLKHNMIDVPTPKPVRPAFVQPKFFGDES